MIRAFKFCFHSGCPRKALGGQSFPLAEVICTRETVTSDKRCLSSRLCQWGSPGSFSFPSGSVPSSRLRNSGKTQACAPARHRVGQGPAQNQLRQDLRRRFHSWRDLRARRRGTCSALTWPDQGGARSRLPAAEAGSKAGRSQADPAWSSKGSPPAPPQGGAQTESPKRGVMGGREGVILKEGLQKGAGYLDR